MKGLLRDGRESWAGRCFNQPPVRQNFLKWWGKWTLRVFFFSWDIYQILNCQSVFPVWFQSNKHILCECVNKYNGKQLVMSRPTFFNMLPSTDQPLRDDQKSVSYFLYLLVSFLIFVVVRGTPRKMFPSRFFLEYPQINTTKNHCLLIYLNLKLLLTLGRSQLHFL